MTRVVVNVMLKPETLDPQGEAIARALPRLGFEGVVGVRQGKRFEIELGDPPGFSFSAPDAGDTPDVGDAEDLGGAEDAENARDQRDQRDALAKARQIAETLLANPVIEDFEVHVLS